MLPVAFHPHSCALNALVMGDGASLSGAGVGSSAVQNWDGTAIAVVVGGGGQCCLEVSVQ